MSNEHELRDAEHDDRELNEAFGDLNKFQRVIGKQTHDQWVDEHVRNLSVDVVQGLESNKRKSSIRFAFGIPAVAVSAIVLALLLKPAPDVEGQNTQVTDVAFVSDEEVESAFLSEISDDEAIEMIADAADGNSNAIVLNQKDLDKLMEDL